jgi:hypothetical protein
VAAVDSNGTSTEFDAVDISFLAGREIAWYRLPTSRVLATFTKGALGKTIVSDITKTLRWFEQYHFVENCLRRLKQGDTLVGPIQDRGIAKDVFDMLCLIADGRSEHVR